MGFFDKVFDDILGDPFGTYHQAAEAKGAAQLQAKYADEGIEESRRQYEVAREGLDPYAQAGSFGMYGIPEGGMPASMDPRLRAQYTNPFAGEIASMSPTDLDYHLANDPGMDPQKRMAMEAVLAGEDPVKAGFEQSVEGQTFDPGGMFSYGQAGEASLPILQQFAQSGGEALQAQQALAGLQGPEAQAEAIQLLESSPEFNMLVKQGEEGMLQNASATGGLRGGDTQRALMEYRPQVLNALIDKQYSRLGGLAGQGGTAAQNLASGGQQAFTNIGSMGQSSAAGQGNAALSMGQNVASLLGNKGALEAAGTNALASARGSGLGQMMNIAGEGMDLFGQGKKLGIF